MSAAALIAELHAHGIHLAAANAPSPASPDTARPCIVAQSGHAGL